MNFVILVKSSEKTPGAPQDIPGVLPVADWVHNAHGALVYASPSDVYLQEGRLLCNGWSPDISKNTWEWKEGFSIDVMYNRFPRRRDPEGLDRVAQSCDELGIPFANHPEFRALARDKWQTVQILHDAGVTVPETVLAWNDVPDALQRWGRAFLKPRYGAFGEDVYVLTQESHSSIHIEGPTAGAVQHVTTEAITGWLGAHFVEHDIVVQCAIAPPLQGRKGFAVRTLWQRDGELAWQSYPRVARVSNDDPVANVDRGASAMPLRECLVQEFGVEEADALEKTASALERQAINALLAALPSLSSGSVVEMGMDLLLDPEHRWWLLEVNGFPQGRLRYLARFAQPEFVAAHHRAHCSPLAALKAASPRNIIP